MEVNNQRVYINKSQIGKKKSKHANPLVEKTRKIAEQLMNLSKDPDHQVTVAKEGAIINALVGYLGNSDLHVVAMSIQAIRYLSNNPIVKPVLCDHPDILARVVDLSMHDNELLGKIAMEVLNNLNSHINCEPQQPVYDHDNQNEQASTSEPTTSSSAKNSKQKKLKFVTMAIQGLSDHDVRTMVTKKILSVPNVVSVTFDHDNELALVCCRPVEGITEELHSLADKIEDMKRAENDTVNIRECIPRYLKTPEEIFEGSGNVSRFGHSTVEERKRREREARNENSRTMSRLLANVGRGIGKGLSAMGCW